MQSLRYGIVGTGLVSRLWSSIHLIGRAVGDVGWAPFWPIGRCETREVVMTQ